MSVGADPCVCPVVCLGGHAGPPLQFHPVLEQGVSVLFHLLYKGIGLLNRLIHPADQ
jgi:hypothetical protein